MTETPEVKGENCPNCGMINSMVVIPKHRNGVHGRHCGKCGHINFESTKTLEGTRDGNMNYKEYQGMK